ncbi:MAG: ATP synthase F1 subunit delta [Anaerolineae bacterium]|nr:ATP synthase F1 subunit delta [Anaerolineae bacterium]
MRREELPLHYAQTLYEMALEEWASWLKSVQQALAEDRALADFLASDEASPAEKYQRLQAVVPPGASEKFRRFLGFLLDKGHLPMLTDVSAAFERLMARGRVREVAHVTSAVELSEEERERITALIRRRFGADVDCEFHVDPSLLGGLHIRVGDTVIDGTLASQLERLREQLLSS